MNDVTAVNLRLQDLTAFPPGSFGSWEILSRDTSCKDDTDRYITKWRCRCTKCNSIRSVSASNLVRGLSKSCGCDKSAAIARSRRNGYEGLSGSYWCHVKYGAKRRGLTVTITIRDAWEQFVRQGHKCAMTGVPLTIPSSTNHGWQSGTASLDRIDNEKGYVLGNIQWLHKDINRMKNTHSVEEFVKLCEAVVKFTRQKRRASKL